MPRARILQVNRSPGGVPKLPLPWAEVTADGVEGDWQRDRRFHGGRFQALCLFSKEILDALASEGYPVGPGSLGENLTTQGLDYAKVRIGDVYRLPSGCRFQITKPRGPCTTIQTYGDGIIKRTWGPAVPWGESGFYARVVESGKVRSGDAIELAQPGPRPPPPFTAKLALVESEFAT